MLKDSKYNRLTKSSAMCSKEAMAKLYGHKMLSRTSVPSWGHILFQPLDLKTFIHQASNLMFVMFYSW